ncbi:type II secretion system protein N [Sphingomicrobium astaxanthinifaciens]|uniref:type II secretion system protein N n=1 Tax=Sphingomicrobium astaxanthinifaciens TaxID=1227949 RepID=UPI001FCA7769|nr:type II secretion system protein N [Sphingomicrobium astaxanthinifaciens]MCJ7421069.1 PDZ domain-containing protein [Sphingomicrobium astaxanthinifaciens]
MLGSILRLRPGRRDRLAFAELHLLARAVLLAILAALLSRLFWVLVTPVGPLGAWQAAEPRLLSPEAQTALLTGYDPFPAPAATLAAGGEGVTDLDLELFGTLLNRGAGTGSAIIAGDDGEQQSYAVGDEVSPGVRLAEVAFDHVVLDRGGVRERLYLDGSVPAEDAAPAAAAAGAGSEATARASIPDYQFEPRRSGSRITGIRLPVTTDPALLSVIGLRPGDVIVGVNGVPVRSQADIDQFKASLKPAARLSLDVERGATTVPIAVNL